MGGRPRSVEEGDLRSRRRPPPDRGPPRLLAGVLDCFLPVALGGNGTIRLGDLDQAAWDHMAAANRFAARGLMAKAVQARLHTLPPDVLKHPLPSPALVLRVLALENRTHTCLARLLPLFPGDRAWTVARYLTITGFGAGCLVDLLSAVEAAGGSEAVVATAASPGRIDRSVSADHNELRAVLLALQARLPLTEDDADEILRRMAGKREPWSVPRLLKRARAAGFEVPFRLLKNHGRTLLVAPTQVALVSTTCTTATRFVRHWGLASIEQIVSQVRALCGQAVDGRMATAVLSSLPRFSWLDRRLGWFWFRDCPNRLVRAFGKVFSVAQRLHLAELSQAVLRAYRFRQRPSRRVMESVCQQLPGCVLQGEWVSVEGLLDREEWLSPAERSLVEILESQGGALSLRSLRQLGHARGVSEGTFVSVVRHSPVVSKLVTADGDQPFFTTVGGPALRLQESA